VADELNSSLPLLNEDGDTEDDDEHEVGEWLTLLLMALVDDVLTILVILNFGSLFIDLV
jgi:hypothetical protein